MQVAGLLWRGILGTCDGEQVHVINEKTDVEFRRPGQRGSAKQRHLSPATEGLIDGRPSFVTRLQDESLHLSTEV
ncbi:hypothetical protein E2C01_040658 [Portunus trituberculatus]|uniref:Uncharacterized protein n=1 Tax=Portunus trituberculatus TaxID=210409 RepID=A0A5B7FNK0_PORTR|nr:hypothetical protein [Portunus trituberculatus]